MQSLGRPNGLPNSRVLHPDCLIRVPKQIKLKELILVTWIVEAECQTLETCLAFDTAGTIR
jgi:hypothetical protein